MGMHATQPHSTTHREFSESTLQSQHVGTHQGAATSCHPLLNLWVRRRARAGRKMHSRSRPEPAGALECALGAKAAAPGRRRQTTIHSDDGVAAMLWLRAHGARAALVRGSSCPPQPLVKSLTAELLGARSRREYSPTSALRDVSCTSSP